MGTKPSIGQGEIIRVALELAAQYKLKIQKLVESIETKKINNFCKIIKKTYI